MSDPADETFNYWEPAHYILYGSGQQTWEYHPDNAFRSYAYVGIAALLGFVSGGAIGVDKVAVFHSTRYALAAACAASETVFYAGVRKRFGPRVALLTFAGLAVSAGMVNAAPAHLTNTFTMCGMLVAWGTWLLGMPSAALAATAVALELGFPFYGLAAAPTLGLHVLSTAVLKAKKLDATFLQKVIAPLALAGVAASALAIGVSALVDRHFYGKWILALWKTIEYNALLKGDCPGTDQGSDRFGYEVDANKNKIYWSLFYAKSLLLNFNVLFGLAALSPLAVFSRWRVSRDGTDAGWVTAILAQLWFWFTYMSSRAHKEERFLFIVYPLIPLAAAFSIDAVLTLAARVSPRLFTALDRGGLIKKATLGVFGVAALVSFARMYALFVNFNAPFAAWAFLSHRLSAGAPAPYARPFRALTMAPIGAAPPSASARVCVGKEWYRFPSSYFLPEHTAAGGRAELAYLRNHFTGLLPQAFVWNSSVGSAENVTGFNKCNFDEPSRYVPPSTCAYIVDFELPENKTKDTEYEPWFFGTARIKGNDYECEECDPSAGDGCAHIFQSVWSAPFLDRDSSRLIGRAFWLPGAQLLRGDTRVFGAYHVIQQKSCKR